ncbi:hypothetical protein [Actinacidiphila sp. ITFR-21]|uniref:hypothetical protein n=1 Tax=Actinacidiphila sp. ITFR-21 TaxID=3075199 RepID=UPI0028893513|nr:hypothetical protein [Streptomyces sp. ITFR-21]WNI16053.1 hypothetical protein RLT57_11290 [Streptomyces sp. ITFR-21]
MPRGRHRHSQPLHRMLPPFTVAGCAAALAAASLFAGDTTALRVITVATALAACAGAGLARSWDLSAGRRVAALETLREREEWHTDERVAELETDLEESRELRARLERKLRGKRAELAGLRTEHADLLRRYATAESERARALEARRKLQLEGSGDRLALSVGPSPVGPAAYLKAAQALRELSRNAAQQQAQATVEEARRRDVAAPDEPQGRHAAAEDGVPATSPAGLPVREHRLIPAVAAAVLPYAQPQRSPVTPGTPPHRTVGGFDFFGTQKGPGHPDDDAEDGPAADPAGTRTGAQGLSEEEHSKADEPASEVIDLTAHDDTEQLDMSELRAKA